MEDRSRESQYLFAALHVEDRDAALRWFERLFGRGPDFLPTETEAVWRVADTASVYILADGARVGCGEVSLVVNDLAIHRAALEARDIVVEPVVVVEGAARKCRVLDPDGNVIWFIELSS